MSIGVQDVATRELLAGAIYVPYVDELFFGEAEGGRVGDYAGGRVARRRQHHGREPERANH